MTSFSIESTCYCLSKCMQRDVGVLLASDVKIDSLTATDKDAPKVS
jgi:hypothetical protein